MAKLRFHLSHVHHKLGEANESHIFGLLVLEGSTSIAISHFIQHSAWRYVLYQNLLQPYLHPCGPPFSPPVVALRGCHLGSSCLAFIPSLCTPGHPPVPVRCDPAGAGRAPHRTPVTSCCSDGAHPSSPPPVRLSQFSTLVSWGRFLDEPAMWGP